MGLDYKLYDVDSKDGGDSGPKRIFSSYGSLYYYNGGNGERGIGYNVNIYQSIEEGD